MLFKKRDDTPKRHGSVRRSAKYLLGHMKPFWPYYILAAFSLLAAVLLNAVLPELQGRIIDEVILDTTLVKDERTALLIKLLSALVLCGLGHAVFNYLKEYTADIVGSRIGKNMRSELFDHIQKLGVGYFSKNNTGELMARIKDDIDKVWFFLGFAGILTLECILHTVVTLVCMMRISPLLTLIPIAMMTAVAFIAVHMEKALDKSYDALSEENAELNNVAQENLAGVRTVKAFSREKFEIEKFRRHNKNYYTLSIELNETLIKHSPYITLAGNVLVVLVVLAGGALMLTGVGEMSLGQLGAFSEYANGIIWPMECLAWLATELASAIASNRKIAKILAEEPEIVEPENPVVLDRVDGRIDFENVSFSLADNQILSDVSFSIESGKTLGIMGLTGSGKSTVINLLERFYDVNSGSVRLDGVDVRSLGLSQLRASVAVVMQNVFLFSDSIAENISMGRRGDMTELEMHKASDAACASEFIDQLDEGYETIIGERGVGLSGGQKQRISIARAFAKRAPVLVLDDATSALDMETEYELQQALRSYSNATKIIIAHRISAVKDADEIIILDNGVIAERGTHDQLMAKRGHYYITFTAQYSTDDVSTIA